MVRHDWVAAYRLLFAVLTIVAIGWQLGWGLQNNPEFKVVQFFRFFTILSNLVAVGVLLGFVVRRHRVMPLVLVVDWLLNPPATRFTRRATLGWLAFPLLWLIDTMIRGPIADWYPYPFLDPDQVGSDAGVIASRLGITLFLAATVWVVVWSARSVRLQRSPGATQA
jgi:hypothetical protein